MPNEAPSGPGPLIWVVVLLTAVAGAIWGVGTAVAVGVATTALFVLIGLALQQSEKLKRAQRTPPLTNEMRGSFDRMLGRNVREASQGSKRAAALGLHLPRHLVPPPGHNLKATIATADMYMAIEAAADAADKAAVLTTRCFENGIHCDASEWRIASATEAAKRVFAGRIEQRRLDELQLIAEEAVRLGYRVATPLDLDVILGAKADNSWQHELAVLVAKARGCVQGTS